MRKKKYRNMEKSKKFKLIKWIKFKDDSIVDKS